MKFETKAIHAGQQPDPTTGAIMTPVYLSSTFVQESPGVHKGYDYSRADNPTRTAYQNCLASLEGGKHGFAFSSGCAATTAVLNSLSAGDHVIAGDDMYGGTFRIFDQVMSRLGIEFSYVDLTNPENFKKHIQDNTQLVWIESPTNPTLKIADIQTIAGMAREKNIVSVVDNTFMSPCFQSPLSLGADVVMHSTTKYIGGHSDMIGGALITNRQDLADQFYFLLKTLGGVASPFDCFLAMRSLKTLPIRMRAHKENAMKVAHFLENHSKVEKVLYPGLESHPQHTLAKKQMCGFGGMISMYLKGGLPEARSFLENVKIFALAESLGGVESLVEHPAIMTHASIPPERRAELGIGDNLIRMSIGIENIDDLIADLEQAL